MGFFSRLFGTGSAEPPQPAAAEPQQDSRFRRFDPQASHADAPEAGNTDAPPSTLLSFDIDWKVESGQLPAAIHDAQVLVTDVDGLSDDALRAVVATRRSKHSPLIVVSPGLHPTALALAGTGDVVSLRAVPLPGQSLRSLLEDLAVFSCACVLTRDLGYEPELSPRYEAEREAAESSPVLALPDSSWADVEDADLGRVAVLRITDRGVSFACARAPRLAEHIAHVLRHESGSDPAGLRARLLRLGRPDAEVDDARSPEPAPDPSTIRIPAGFASPFFVTDAASYQAVLDKPRVLLSAVPLERLDVLLPFLQRAARDSSSVVVIAPAFGSRALAMMVTNKLRGMLSCLAIELGSAPGAADATLATLAAATGAEILVTADQATHRDWIGDVLGTAAKVAAGPSSSTVWPAPDRGSKAAGLRT